MKKLISIILIFFGTLGIALAQSTDKTKNAWDTFTWEHFNTFERILCVIALVGFFLSALINLLLALKRLFGSSEDGD